MTLKRVACYCGEQVDETVIAKLREKGLFIAKGVHCDHTWGCIGNFDNASVRIGHDQPFLSEHKTVAACAGLSQYPLQTFRRGLLDGFRKSFSKSKGINYVTAIFLSW